MEKYKYISFEGKRIRVYWLRGEYCVIDKDLAEFFSITKKYLLFTASINKKRFSEFDVFLINDIEYHKIKKHNNMLLSGVRRKIYAFNLKGIITIAQRTLKSEIAAKLSIWVIRTVVNNENFDIFELLRSGGTADILKET